MRFTVTTLALALMTFSAGITMEPAYAAGAGKEDSQKISSAAVSQRARFKFVKEYGSERELNAERYKNRGWIEKTGDGVFFYDGRGKVKKEIKRKLSSIENPIDERIDDRRFRRTYAEIFNDGLGALVREREYEVEGYDKIVPSTWTIYGPQGEIQGRFVDDRYYRPSPNGKHFVGTLSGAGWVDGVLRFRDENGEVTHEHKPFEWEVLEERIVFSDDGKSVIFLGNGADVGGMAVFDWSGKALGEYDEVKWDPIGPSTIGPDGVMRPNIQVSYSGQRILVLDSEVNLTCFDFSAQRVWRLKFTGPLTFGVSPSAKSIIVFEIKRDFSRLHVVDGEKGDFHDYPLDLRHAPSVASNPYLSEKPKAFFQALTLNDFIVLGYKDARTKNRGIVSGLTLFDFTGQELDTVLLNNPKAFDIHVQGTVFVRENSGGGKQWVIKKAE